MELKNKTILITGGAGFIGSNLCEHFLQHNKVICLDDLSTGKKANITPFLSNDNFIFIEKSITDFEVCKEATQDVDIIFHQAALGSVPRSIETPRATNEVNITGFLNMLDAARINHVERFIYAASSSTYGDSKKLPKVEHEIGKPLSPYAVTKQVNELYAHVFSNLYGMKIIGLRYFNVYGRRQDPDGQYAAAIPKFIKAFLEGGNITIHGDGKQTRDFTFVEDVVQINELAAISDNHEAFNQVYNVAYGSNITVIELVEYLKTLLKEKGVDVSKSKLIQVESRVGDVRDSLASVAKAKELLNYQPNFHVKDGLKKAIQWYIDSFGTKDIRHKI